MAPTIAVLMSLEENRRILEDDPWRHLSTYKNQLLMLKPERKMFQNPIQLQLSIGGGGLGVGGKKREMMINFDCTHRCTVSSLTGPQHLPDAQRLKTHKAIIPRLCLLIKPAQNHRIMLPRRSRSHCFCLKTQKKKAAVVLPSLRQPSHCSTCWGIGNTSSHPRDCSK